MQKTRDKFTTTLDVTTKQRLNTLAKYNNKDCNDLIEDWVDKEWEVFVNEVANKSRDNRRED